MDINNLWSNYDLNSKKQNSRCLSVNTILEGKYLVGPVLGQGGFGITYVGYDLNMESKIAIKEYFPVELVSRDTTTMHGDRVLSLSGEKSVTYKQGLKKYVAEAQNVSQFSEIPGVVSVKDFFYANETAYIVMEYIDGISLKDYLKEKGGRLTEEETLKIMKPVLEALVQVHKSGIIHRDISPDNIMLTFEDAKTHSKIKSVKLIDFGAARMTAKNDQKSLTIILKHGYAPEEQYRTHGEQGPWTDVYALCAVLYRMLTGETPVPVMDRMFKDELKTLEQCGTKVSSNTSAAIIKGLAVKKDDRIQSVQELIGALYDGAKVRPAVAKMTSKNHSMIAAGAVAVSVAAVAFFMVIGSNGKKDAETNEGNRLETSVDSTAAASEVTNAADDMLEMEADSGDENRIVWTSPEVLLAGGDDYVISLREDGTVLAAGNNEWRQCEVSDWYDIAAVYSSRTASAGLSKEGTVVIAGNEELNEAVSSWSGIVELAMDSNYVLGLTENGTVISAGSNEKGSCETGDWKDVASVWSAVGVSFGITNNGELLIAGTDEFYENELAVMKEWKDLKQVGFVLGEGYFYGLKTDGTILHTSTERKEELDTWTDITYLVPSCYGLVGLKSDGTISATHKGLEQVCEGWSDVVSVAGTLDYLAALKEDGTIVITDGRGNKNEMEGVYPLEKVLAMEDLKQAVWVNDYLMILCENGEIIASAAEGFNFSKVDIPQWNEPVERLVPDHKGVVGLTPDGRVLREERDYLSLSVSALEMDVDEAQKRKDQTPRRYEDWQNVVQLSNGSNQMAALMKDGTVRVAGFPEVQPATDYKTGLPTNGTDAAEKWADIKQVQTMMWNTIGLKEDGTLVWTAEEDWFDYLGEYDNLNSIWADTLGNEGYIAGIGSDGEVVSINLPSENGMNNTAGWGDLVKLDVSEAHLVGLQSNGKVLACGSNFAGKCDVEEWQDVVDISTCSTATVGITSDGRLLMAGAFPNDIYQAEKWPGMDLEEISETRAADLAEMDAEAEELGEIIVMPTPQTDYASGTDHVVIRNEDGTVRTLGLNQYGQGAVSEWISIAAVTAGEKFSAGLRADGTVLVAGELRGKDEVERWEDIVAISGSRNCLYGLTKEGKILVSYVGKGSDAEFLEWENIKAIASFNEELAALDESGHVYITGQLHMSGGLPHDLDGWTDVEQIVRTKCVLLGVKPDGRLRYDLFYDEADIIAEDIEDAMDLSNLDTFENVRQVFANRWGIYAVDTEGNTHVGGYAVSGDEMYTVDDEVASWKNLIGVTGVSGDNRIAGIQADGQIVTTLDNLGRHKLEEMTNLEKVEITNRDRISNGMGILGYGKDGTIYSYGDAEFLRYLELGDPTNQPTEIISIWTGEDGWRVNLVACVGSDGNLYIQKHMGLEIQSDEHLRGSNIKHIAYDSNQDCLVAVNTEDKIELYELSDLPVLDPFKQTESWENIDQVAMLTDTNEFGTCIFGLHQDGTVSAVSENGEVSAGFEDWKDVKELESNRFALGAVLGDGTVRFWDNAPDQNIGQYNTIGWSGIQQLALGMYHTVGLKEDGTVYAVGSNAAGQCQVDDWKDIVSIAAGDSCTIGVKADGSMVIAGEIGW